MRGAALLPGLHTVRLTEAGVPVFARIMRRTPKATRDRSAKRLSIGVAAVDALLGGGIPEWASLLVTGPAGWGKVALATRFSPGRQAAGPRAGLAVAGGARAGGRGGVAGCEGGCGGGVGGWGGGEGGAGGRGPARAIAWTKRAVGVRFGAPPRLHDVWVWAGAVGRA